MKEGRSLQAVAAAISEQARLKEDFVVDTRELTMLGGRELHLPNEGEFAVSQIAHRQIGDRLGIPAKFYDRLRSPDTKLDDEAREQLRRLLDTNVNTLFRQAPERRMIRTFKPVLGIGSHEHAGQSRSAATALVVDPQPGMARAFLSDRYRRRDNDELAEHVLPMLGEIEGLQIKSCEVTDAHLYLKAVTPRLEADVGLNDFVQAGVVIKNSEVGHGSLSVQPLIFRLVCLNGMIAGEATRHYHVGANVRADEDYRVFSDDTLRKDDAAFFAKVADVVKAAVSETAFNAIVGQLREAKETRTLAKPKEAMERLQKRLVLTDDERESVLAHLITGADLSAYGVINAVTCASQDAASYERATDMEAMGGEVLSLALNKPREWEAIAA